MLWRLTSSSSTFSSFGLGPHRARITVGFIEETEGSSSVSETTEIKPTETESRANRSVFLRDFVIELAPLSLMPHSVHFFLEMVRLKIWDGTVFMHQEDLEHVVAAVPFDYAQQRMKHHHLVYLGRTELGFLEYSPEWNHDKYTIGFSIRGPTFYVNTMDNGHAHGPGGGQSHHLLDHDADPCFARVVEGRDVVDELIAVGSSDGGSDERKRAPKHTVNDHPWASGNHTVSYIVRIELL